MSRAQDLKPELLGYLCVDRFLKNPINVAALHYCVSRGLIDRWAEKRAVHLDAMLPNAPILIAMLIDAGVLVEHEEGLVLSASFLQAWKYSDLMTTKLEFCQSMISDVESFALWLENPEEFQAHSKLFGLFDYGRCLELTQSNIQATSKWVKLTTVLSRYEAPLFVDALDWQCHRDWMDLGGNSGEFAMQICNRFHQLKATVLDLPVVCHLGERHIESFGMSDRVRFEVGDLMQPSKQPGFDLVSFKSVLHDWPDGHVGKLIQHAWDRLVPGGRLVIIERVKSEAFSLPTGLGQAPVWMFWNYYRSPAFYGSILKEQFRIQAETQLLNADMTWMLLQAVKPKG